MILYYLIFFGGLVPGFFIQQLRKGQAAYRTMLGCGYAMVALFGLQMGSAREFRHALPGDLFSAMVIALAAAVGSVLTALLFAWAVFRIAGQSASEFPRCSSQAAASPPSRSRLWRPTMAALILLCLGIMSGRLLPVIRVDAVLRLLLLTMIAAVGVQSGQSLRSHFQRREKQPKIEPSFLVVFFGLPVFIMAGSLLFSAGTGLFLKYTWSECMLCASPMGWQTLGGPMIQDLRGPRLGSVAFLTNMFRDIVSLLLIPLVSRGRFALLGVAPGGVSTMDILLPGIMAASGPHYLMLAMWVGACCSFWAPILIGLIAQAWP